MIFFLYVVYLYRIKNKKQFVNFLTWINDLHFAIKYCQIHHFAFNVIVFSSYLVLFKRAENNLTLSWNWNFMKNNIPEKFSEISRSQIIWALYVETLHWVCRLNSITQRAVLSNIRNDIDSITLKAIYHAIIKSHLYYSSLVWAKSFIHLKKESFNKKLQLVRFTDSSFFGSCFRLEIFSSNKFICTVIFFAIFFMLPFSWARIMFDWRITFFDIWYICKSTDSF